MKAIVIGATGAVGMELLDVLIRDPRYEQVLAFARRDPGMKAEKLRFYRVDFNRPEEWQEMVRGDVLFSALGTSKKQAGSKEAQYHIDYDYQVGVARIARENGVPRMVLVSSVGANSSSRWFYLRLKGQIEEDIAALRFDGLTILQPPSLIRKHAKRRMEVLSVKFIQLLNLAGLARSMAPVSTETVASCMAETGAEPFCGIRRITGQEIRRISR